MSSSPSITIRLATREDLGAIRELLSARDGKCWREEDMEWLFHGLNPEHCVAWLAWDHARLVGMSSVFVRILGQGARRFSVAYWNNLYISPGYEGQMLYPRLPMVMFDWVRQEQLGFIYAAVRRSKVSRAHQAIGFVKIGEIRTLVKLLRPARLIARYKQFGAVAEAIAWSFDQPFRLGTWCAERARKRANSVSQIRIELAEPSHIPVGLAPLIGESAQEMIAQAWSASSMGDRFRRTAEGEHYQLRYHESQGQLDAAAIYRITDRIAGIPTAVIMEVAAKPDALRALRGILVEIACEARQADCDLLLAMQGNGPVVDRILRKQGWRWSPEHYDLLIWPARAVDDDPIRRNITNWRFTMGDHDAY